MNEFLQGATSLPNLHPAVVHFPLALAPIALFCELVALTLRPHREPWRRAADLLWTGAALGAAAAFWAGRQAADGLVGVAPRVQAKVATHADWALWTLWALAALAVIHLVVGGWLRRIRSETPTPDPMWRPVLIVPGILVLGMLLLTADLGGELVYRHAVAVRLPEPDPIPVPAETALPEEETSSTIARPEERADGSIVWMPNPEDEGALGDILTPVGSAAGEARFLAPSEGQRGLGLEVAGATLWQLPLSLDDLHLEVEMDLSEFSGTIGLAHHVVDRGTYGLFGMTSDGAAWLSKVEGGSEESLDRSKGIALDDPVRLEVSVAGKHLKGLVGGEMVVHGHTRFGEKAGVGFLFDGQGVIRLHRVTITDLESAE